jgi:splicing suppressor protein 51
MLTRAAPSVRVSLKPCTSSYTQQRTIFGLFKSKAKPVAKSELPDPIPSLAQDDLFHPLAQSPFSDLRERAERVRAVSICPVSIEKYNERVRPMYDCEDCGWPTHRSRQRWEEGKEEHSEVCQRLKEVNEDDHDLRSGRRMVEFERMPRRCQQESTNPRRTTL